MYLFASSGVAMNVHYCMGKEAGVDYYKTTAHKCSKCGMKEKKGGCCNDEHKFYKLSTEYKDVANKQSVSFATAMAMPVYFSYQQFLPWLIAFAKSLNNSPPHFSQEDIGIRHCVFRI